MKKNILILVTHGSYYIPYFLRILLNDDFKKYNNRLLKNFSDYGTKFLVDNIENKIICNYSRALGDPNRDIKAGDLFMDNDFNGIKIWKYNLPGFIKSILIKKYYNSYHKQIDKKISELEKIYPEIIILDIHDTGNLMMGNTISYDTKRDYYFPEINIGNFDYTSCTKDFSEKVEKLFKKEFGFIPKVNWPYDGGFITKKYGVGFDNRQVIQVEFGRYLYINEETQEIDFDKIKYIREKFEKVIENL